MPLFCWSIHSYVGRLCPHCKYFGMSLDRQGQNKSPLGTGGGHSVRQFVRICRRWVLCRALWHGPSLIYREMSQSRVSREVFWSPLQRVPYMEQYPPPLDRIWTEITGDRQLSHLAIASHTHFWILVDQTPRLFKLQR